MAFVVTKIVFLLLFQAAVTAEAIFNKADLWSHLFANYTKGIRPYCAPGKPVVVIIDFSILQILDMDEPKQVITLSLWLRHSWNDCDLTWDPINFNNVTAISVLPENIWKPDITIYEKTGSVEREVKNLATILYDGSVQFYYPLILKAMCPVDVTKFPFDSQRCRLRFGSWVYSLRDIDVVNKSSHVDQSVFVGNGEWQLSEITIERNETMYSCCVDAFVVITYTFVIRRLPQYYILNLMFPCGLVCLVAMLSFCLPPESGEKVSIGITVVLSLTVFLLVVAESMPATSETVPMIGKFFTGAIILVSLSCIMTVIVLNVHFRSFSSRPLPRWIKFIVFGVLGRCFWLGKSSRKYEIKSLPHVETATSNNNATIARNRSYNSSRRDQNLPIKGKPMPDNDGRTEFRGKTDDDGNEEWRDAAIILDRLFLVLYVIMVVVVMCTIILA